MSVAEALLAPGIVPGAGEKDAAAAQASAAHPFPAAVSEGLASAAEVPQAPAGQVHTQVSDTLSYNAAAAEQPSAPASAASPGAPAAPAAAKPPRDLAHVIGRFFRRMFGGK
jgi:hypothetical protein